MANKQGEPDAAAWAAALKHETRYRKALGGYFATFAVKERGLKKWIEKARVDWIAAGCPAGGPEFPPLDEPAKLLAWWQGHMTREPSAILYSLAGQTSPDAEVAHVSVPSDKRGSGEPPAPAAAAQPRTVINVNDLEGVDLASAAAMARKTVAVAWAEYDSAQRDPNSSESTLTMRAKRFDMAVERLRKIEDSVTDAEKKRGYLIHVDVLRAEIAPLLQSLANAIPLALVEQLGMDRARALVVADKLFRDLRGSRFLAGTVPSLTPSTAAA